MARRLAPSATTGYDARVRHLLLLLCVCCASNAFAGPPQRPAPEREACADAREGGECQVNQRYGACVKSVCRGPGLDAGTTACLVCDPNVAPESSFPAFPVAVGVVVVAGVAAAWWWTRRGKKPGGLGRDNLDP